MSETVTPNAPGREVADRAPASLQDTNVPTATAPSLGLIGLGTAGRDIGATLLHAGFRLLAGDTDPELAAAFAQTEGAALAPPDQVAARSTILLLVLDLGSDADATDGALQHLAPGALVIDMGPALPGNLRRMAATLAKRGVRLMDAPLLHAETPIVLAGGSEADLDFARQVLASLGTILHAGAVGAGQALVALVKELEEAPSLGRVQELAGKNVLF